MINICKISRKQLPALYESYEKVGCITKEAAMELGLPDNVCVVAGAGDNVAAAVGTELLGTECAIFLLEQAEQYLYQAVTLALIIIMHFIPLTTRTAIIILWAVC